MHEKYFVCYIIYQHIGSGYKWQFICASDVDLSVGMELIHRYLYAASEG